jgi:LysR family glycine cleavage system transcriptional activator
MMRRRLPPLNALRAFEAAGRLGRFTMAADELLVTHGAVSRQVKLLEEALGIALFDGPRNRPRLTETGRRLLHVLTGAFDLIEDGVRAAASGRAGGLRVSCYGTFTMHWLIPRLHRFQARQPDVEVRFSASEVPLDFARAQVDLAVRVGRPPWPEGVEATPFLVEYAGPVLSPRLSVRHDIAGPDDLHALPRLHTATRRRAWPDWLRAHGLSWPDCESGPEFEHFYYLLEAAIAGLGVAIGPWPLVAADVRAGRLWAPLGFRQSGLTYVVYLPRGGGSEAAVAFRDWLVEEGGRERIRSGAPAAVPQ